MKTTLIELHLMLVPKPIINIIKDYLWGSKLDYIIKYNNCIKTLPINWYNQLNPIEYQKRNDIIYTELDTNDYCFKCGEKTIFPFTQYICGYC
jgi:hypothetical protein